jgi:hypothetical protein
MLERTLLTLLLKQRQHKKIFLDKETKKCYNISVKSKKDILFTRGELL